MIYLYSGTPGSGKSLHQAIDIYWILHNGKPVLANFEINTEKIKTKHLGEFHYISNDILSPQLLINYSRDYFKSHPFKEGAIRLYLDECSILFSCRDWSVKGRREWISFFSQHRKYGYDIYLVAQFDRMIDRQIRSLIEYEIIHRKVKNFGRWGKFFNLLAGGSLFVAVTMWYPMKERTQSEFFKASKKYFAIYDTYNTFSTEGEVTQNGNNTHTQRCNKLDAASSISDQIKILNKPSKSVICS